MSLGQNQTMRYLAVFAHFDRDNLIDDYVVNYINSLKKIATDVIFVSDSELEEEELLKVKALTAAQICGKHGEYDFGSFKRGISFAQEYFFLDNYDGLILANDSCYLVSSLMEVFEKMEKIKSFDFWGMTQNSERGIQHIQSYFMVFNKQVFSEMNFLSFFASIKIENSKDDIIEKYELGLTKTLVEAGFREGSFMEKIYKNNPVANNIFFDELLPQKFPFIKVDFLKTNPLRVYDLKRIESAIPEEQLIIIRKHLNRFCPNFAHWELKRPPMVVRVLRSRLNWLKAKLA